MMDLNIRNVDGELVRELKVEALTLGLTLRELCIRKLRGPVAQLEEQEPHKPQGAGSIPAGTTTPSMEYLRAVCAGQVEEPEPEPEPESVRMCTYKEYDSDTGEWYGCALPEHSAKTKHKRGRSL
jgi:hypothetical protein